MPFRAAIRATVCRVLVILWSPWMGLQRNGELRDDWTGSRSKTTLHGTFAVTWIELVVIRAKNVSVTAAAGIYSPEHVIQKVRRVRPDYPADRRPEVAQVSVSVWR